MREVCSICGHNEFEPTPYVNLMGLGANLVVCRNCRVRCYDRPVCTPVEAYDNPASHTLADNCLKFGAMNNLDEAETERFRAAHRSMYVGMLNTIKSLLSPAPMARIYEVGSNIGEFLDIARGDFLCEVAGCEPNRRGTEIARGMGIPLEHAFFQDAHPGEGWDAVVMLDVIEHTDTPVEDLVKAHGILKKGGVVLLKTFYDEFHKGVDPRILQTPEAWKLGLWEKGYFDPVQHVFHFPKQLLLDTIKMPGFRLAAVSDSTIYGQLTVYGVKE